MLDIFLSHIQNQHPYLVGGKVIVAVSGGLDSMVLLDLMSKLTDQIIVVHINYNMRGVDSEGDEDLVRAIALRIGAECIVKQADPAFLKAGNFQENSRNFRYTVFDEVADTYNIEYVCIAHHADDQAETVLMNLVRGSNSNGLTGMEAVNGRYIRPLLTMRRSQIASYAESSGVQFREDSSNGQNFYLRNTIRNRVIPVLEDFLPNISKRILATSSNLKTNAKLLDTLVTKTITPYLSAVDQNMHIDKSILEIGPHASAVLGYYFNDYGFTADQVENLLHPALQTGKYFESAAYLLTNDRAHFTLTSKDQQILVETRINNPDFMVTLGNGATLSDRADAGIPKDVIHLRKENLTFPLLVRSWQFGDRITFSEDGSRKKVKKLFQEYQISRANKSSVPILVNGDGELIWVVGLKKSTNFNSKENGYKIYYNLF